MPHQAQQSPNNLLELLKETASYTPEAFAIRFNSRSPSGVTYASTVNDRLPYTANKKIYFVNPLEFAIANRLFYRIPHLFDNGATHEIPNFNVFSTLVLMNAPLDVLLYCIQHNKCHAHEKYPALLAAYNKNHHDPYEKFEAIHKYCFGLSFDTLLRGKKPHGMSRTHFEKAVNAYSLMLERSDLLEDTVTKNKEKQWGLKSIYLDIIQHSHHHRSHLKISLVFNKENPIVNVLKTNGTAHFQALQEILKAHTLDGNNVDSIRSQLDHEAGPNQALAGLYFAYYDFSTVEDYKLFSKNLVTPRNTFNQLAQRHFECLLRQYLNKAEMIKLKKNCLVSIQHDPSIKKNFGEELKGKLARSPMGTIVRTGTTTRKEKTTGTLREAMKFCLFGKNTPIAPQLEPHQEPDYLNVPPAYNPEYARL